MTKKLFVGNLSYDATEDQLRTLFNEIGPVTSVSIITDRFSGRSKGFAFVEMETEEAARTAIEKLNNREVNARSVTVSEARPQRERSGGFEGGRGGGRGGRSGSRDRDRDRGGRY